MVPGELQHVGPRLVRYCVFKTPIYLLEQISIGEKNLLSNITIVLQFYSSKFNTDSHINLFMRPIALWEIICSFDSVVRIASSSWSVTVYLTNQFWIFQDPVPDLVWNIGLGGIDQVLD